MEDDKQIIEDIENGVKSLHEKIDGYGKESSEVKSTFELLKADVKKVVEENEKLAAKLAGEEERTKLIEERLAKSSAPSNVDVKQVKSAIDYTFRQAFLDAGIGQAGKSFADVAAELKTRAVTDAQQGGHLVDTRLMQDMMITYIKDSSPMLREANVVRDSAHAIRVPYKELRFGAQFAAEKQASEGKTKRWLKTRTIHQSRIYSEDSTTSEFMRAQSIEGESSLVDDIMMDIAYQIQEACLRGDGLNKPWGLLTEQFLADTATTSVAAAGKVTWEDLINVQKAFNYERYREQGKFFMSFDVLAEFLKEKDLEGRPLYLPNLISTRPQTLQGYSVVIMPTMDKTIAANTLPVLFGNMKAYTILMDGNYKVIRDEITEREKGIINVGVETMAGGSIVDEEAMRAIKGA